MQNGVVSNKSGKGNIENVAVDYFDELLRKAFIQPSRVPGLCRVDDMLRDIALYIGPMPPPKERVCDSMSKNKSRLIDQRLVKVKL